MVDEWISRWVDVCPLELLWKTEAAIVVIWKGQPSFWSEKAYCAAGVRVPHCLTVPHYLLHLSFHLKKMFIFFMPKGLDLSVESFSLGCILCHQLCLFFQETSCYFLLLCQRQPQGLLGQSKGTGCEDCIGQDV